MRNLKIQDDDKITQHYDWTVPVEIQSAFGNRTFYSLGSSKDPKKPNIFKKLFKNFSIPKPLFKKRQAELEKFQHQFSVPSTFADIKSKEISKQQVIITQFSVLNPYVHSISVSNYIKQKGQLILSDFNSIIQQMVNLMVVAQQQQIYHYHLNANSILLIQNNNQTPYFLLKVTDWGFHNQICSRKDIKKTSDFLKKICQSSMFQYLHPELLFQADNLELYQKYKSKYDIWSFGVILYRLAYLKRPFEKNGSFSPQKLEDYYKAKKSLKIQIPGLLTTIIQKMLSLEDFKTWAQIKEFLIEKCERVSCDFWPMRQTFEQHKKLLDYMIEIYKLVGWSMHNSVHIFWYQNKSTMEKFLFHLVKFMRLVHFKFLQRFGYRIGYLAEQQIQQYSKLINAIQAQFKLTEIMKTQNVVEKDFFDSFAKFTEHLVPLQTRIQDFPPVKNYVYESSMGMQVKNNWKSLAAIKEFSFRIMQAKKKMKNCTSKILQSLFEAIPQKL